MHVAKRNVILLYFSKLQIQYATNFYRNLFHIIDTYTEKINKKRKYYVKKILEKDWNVNINNSMCI